MTAEEFITDRTAEGDSPAEDFREAMAQLLGNLDTDNEVFSVHNHNSTGQEKITDVMFSSHGSPNYPKARLIGLVTANKDMVSHYTKHEMNE